MRITDELREYVDRHEASCLGMAMSNYIRGIADRIDIAHKHAIGYVDDRDPETMAENGWVRLPKDAEGKYIHVGDMMECKVFDGTRKRLVKAVSEESFIGVQVEPVDGLGYVEYVAHEHYHHEPTVEDVLREFAVEVCGEPALTIRSGVVEEYASRLRLAGES